MTLTNLILMKGKARQPDVTKQRSRRATARIIRLAKLAHAMEEYNAHHF